MMIFSLLNVNTYHNIQSIREKYTNGHDLVSLGLRMNATGEKRMKENGCPEKYLFNVSDCPKELNYTIWENYVGVDGYTSVCLNEKCGVIVANYICSPLVSLIGLNLWFVSVGLVISIGGFYLWKKNCLDIIDKKQSHLMYLDVFMLVMVLTIFMDVFMTVVMTYSHPFSKINNA